MLALLSQCKLTETDRHALLKDPLHFPFGVGKSRSLLSCVFWMHCSIAKLCKSLLIWYNIVLVWKINWFTFPLCLIWNIPHISSVALDKSLYLIKPILNSLTLKHRVWSLDDFQSCLCQYLSFYEFIHFFPS